MLDAVDNLLAALESPSSTEAQIRDSAQQLIDAALEAPAGERNLLLERLARAFYLDDLDRSAFAALLAGTLLEEGYEPGAVCQPLLALLERLLEPIAALAAECEKRIPADLDDDSDPFEFFEAARRDLGEVMVHETQAWEALNSAWPAGVVLFSLSKEARSAGRALRPLAARSSEYHEGAGWLELILSALDDEPFLAIEPATLLGIRGRTSGIVDNFQLHTLLMDVFPGGDPSTPRVSQSAAEIARGAGPQQSGETVTGCWNLYAWTALEPDLALPAASDTGANRFWIWGEGKPEDIPIFDGLRIILLGPPSYIRTWPSQRAFTRLRADLSVEAVLSEQESRTWLERITHGPATA